MAATFEFRDVGVRFGSVDALSGVNLSFDQGAVALIGPNGSGKTTLLRLLAGLQAPTRGVIEAPRSAAIAYVAQLTGQHHWMPLTVGEVILTARYRRSTRWRRMTADDHRAVLEAASRLGVHDVLERRFADLSGGRRQRTLIARAVAAHPTTLLLDEPITGLDPTSQQLILDLITEQRDQGHLVVFSTHHLEETENCDRVILVNGYIVADGRPADVLSTDNLAELFGAHLIHPDSTAQPLVIDEHVSHDH